MGQANRRGTFEQRKEQAIAEGREKKPISSNSKVARDMMKDFMPYSPEESFSLDMILAMAMARRRLR